MQKNLKPSDYRYAIFFIGLLSFAVILYGVICLINFKSVKKHCTAAGAGTVVGIESKRSKAGSFFEWNVAFTAADGCEYTFKTGSTREKAGKGDICAVMYDPEKPSRAYAPEAPPDNGVTRICSGIAIMIISCVILFFKMKSGGLLR
ncbi:MAG: DUF3592 domain-containing protein [Ruminococcus sp.]|nr:DUF3592 domain-containing protein [Ruminococcus sp.]